MGRCHQRTQDDSDTAVYSSDITVRRDGKYLVTTVPKPTMFDVRAHGTRLDINPKHRDGNSCIRTTKGTGIQRLRHCKWERTTQIDGGDDGRTCQLHACVKEIEVTLSARSFLVDS